LLQSLASSPASRDELVLRHMPLARHLARRYATDADYDDLVQVAAIGLMKAVDRFDPDRGTAFSSFAMPTILGELKRYFRDLGWTVRVPRRMQELALSAERETERLTAALGRSPTVDELAGACQVSPEQILEARATASAHFPVSLDRLASEEDEDGEHRPQLVSQEEPGYGRVERAVDLERLLTHLDERELTVLRLRFEHDLIQREIAERVGISQMQVSRVIARAIKVLQAASGVAASDAPSGSAAGDPSARAA
jgi:RNA polymerase sigma-B factor